MAEEIKQTGEVGQATATVALEDVLQNEGIMAELLKSEIVTKLIQSEVDKVRTNASLQSKEKIENIAKQKDTEFSLYKAETDKKIEELTAFQKNYFRTETLKKTGIELDLWDYVKGETEEEIKASAEALKGIISKKAELTVGGKVGNVNSYKGITKEQFGKMTYAEKADLYQNNQELYEKLSKGE